MKSKKDRSSIKGYILDMILYERVTQKELQQILGISKAQASKIFNIDNDSFLMNEDLVKLSFRLGVSIDDIYANKCPDDFYKVVHEDCLKDENVAFIGNVELPSFYLKPEILDHPRREELLNGFIKSLDRFVRDLEGYLKGNLSYDKISDSLHNVYCTYSEGACDDNIYRAQFERNDLERIKEIYKLNNSGYDYESPYIYPVNANYVMLYYYNSFNNKNLVYKYLDLLYKLDNIFNYCERLRYINVSNFFEAYEELMSNKEIVDVNGRLCKEILRRNGRLKQDFKYKYLLERILSKGEF